MFSEKLWMFVFHGFGICMCSNLFSSSKPKLVFKSFKDFILPFSFKADQRTLIISQLFGLIKGFDISIDVFFTRKYLGSNDRVVTPPLKSSILLFFAEPPQCPLSSHEKYEKRLNLLYQLVCCVSCLSPKLLLQP